MNSMVICLIIFAVMIILFFNRKIPMAFTSMGVIVALYVAGCVDKATVFAGFGNNNVLTMAGMFIVAAGLSRTQMVNNITKLLYRVNNGSFTRVLASYILVIFLLGQFVPSLPAMFAMVYPLVISMCKQLKCSPSKMMYPIAVTVVSTSFVIEPIGPYAAWFVTQNGYLESYGWTGSPLSMWSETMVFLPTALVTLLLTIFVLPKLMPDQPETETAAITGPDITNNEALSPVREFLGYGIFIATVIGLMLGLPSWAVTMAGATAVVLSGVLDEQTALIRMNMSMVLLYAGVTVMGEALGNTGAAQLLGDLAAGALSGVRNGYIIGAVFYLVSFLMTSFLYNRATTTVLIPILIISCSSIGCDPRGPVILCSLASMSSLITPMPNPVVPMAMQAGGYTQKTILRVGIIPAIVRGIVGVAIAMTIFPAFG
ncbi:SLC13 family permease [Gemmiger formicilis]|jgi:sodium-dependent dicarboxylate transporter 2/3/5|uniref:SLC13 family permease n=1 Tax=Gemmiger formicilis TaxID=745368 RepID=UPI0022E155A1|nr:SLC13 family permease [Gemmiger formicilis]